MKPRIKKPILVSAVLVAAALVALYFLDPQVFDAIMPFDADPTDCCVQDPLEQN